MSQSSASSTSGPLIFGNSSNESPWIVPVLIVGFVAAILGLGYFLTKGK